MTLFQYLNTHFLPNKRASLSLAASKLVGHDQIDKQNALKAVYVLVEYKATVHDFTDEIVEFWPLPRLVIGRYHFENAEQLNEWLDTLS